VAGGIPNSEENLKVRRALEKKKVIKGGLDARTAARRGPYLGQKEEPVIKLKNYRASLKKRGFESFGETGRGEKGVDHCRSTLDGGK